MLSSFHRMRIDQMLSIMRSKNPIRSVGFSCVQVLHSDSRRIASLYIPRAMRLFPASRYSITAKVSHKRSDIATEWPANLSIEWLLHGHFLQRFSFQRAALSIAIAGRPSLVSGSHRLLSLGECSSSTCPYSALRCLKSHRSPIIY